MQDRTILKLFHSTFFFTGASPRGAFAPKNSIFKDIIQIEVDLPPSDLDNVFKYTGFFLEITPYRTIIGSAGVCLI